MRFSEKVIRFRTFLIQIILILEKNPRKRPTIDEIIAHLMTTKTPVCGVIFKNCRRWYGNNWWFQFTTRQREEKIISWVIHYDYRKEFTSEFFWRENFQGGLEKAIEPSPLHLKIEFLAGFRLTKFDFSQEISFHE